MTDIASVEKRCAHCGNMQRSSRINSISWFEAPDLDLRPPKPARYFVGTVDWCRACGYCAPDLEEHVPDADEVMKRPQYVALADLGLPPCVLACRRWAMIASAVCHERRAAEAWKWCAWAAEDGGQEALAVEFRMEAARWHECVRERRAWRDAEPGTVETITADLWRQARHWDRALRAAEWGLDVAVEQRLRSVLAFEVALIARQDAACYTTAAARYRSVPVA